MNPYFYSIFNGSKQINNFFYLTYYTLKQNLSDSVKLLTPNLDALYMFRSLFFNKLFIDDTDSSFPG